MGHAVYALYLMHKPRFTSTYELHVAADIRGLEMDLKGGRRHIRSTYAYTQVRSNTVW